MLTSKLTKALALTLTFAVSMACWSDNKIAIAYQAETDTISLLAQDDSLLAVLQQLSKLSGIEIKAHTSLDRSVSGRFHLVKTEALIDQLTKSLDTVKSYVPTADGGKVLAQVTLLEKGEASIAYTAASSYEAISIDSYSELGPRMVRELANMDKTHKQD